MANAIEKLNFLTPIASFATIIGLWQALVIVFNFPPYILPPPIDILYNTVTQIDTFADAAFLTFWEVVAGFFVGAVIALIVALLMTLAPRIERMCMPAIVITNCVPPIAFIPLALVWFGLGSSSKIAMAALAVVFPVLYNCLSGLKRVDDDAANLLRSFGAGSVRILWKLRLPAAMPSLVTGLRIGMTRSTIAVIVTEMVGAYAGLGQIIFRSTGLLKYVDVWSAVFVASLGSMLLYGVLVAIDIKLIWWK